MSEEKKEHHGSLIEHATEHATEGVASVGERAASAAEKLGGEQVKPAVDTAKVAGGVAALGAKVGAGAVASAFGGHTEHTQGHGSSGQHGHSRVVRAARGHPVAPTGAQHHVAPASGPVAGQHAAQGHQGPPIVPAGASAPAHQSSGKNTRQNHAQQWATRRKNYGASGRGGGSKP